MKNKKYNFPSGSSIECFLYSENQIFSDYFIFNNIGEKK